MMSSRLVSVSGSALDAGGLRQALGRFATGVTVITTRAPDGTPLGLTANSFSAVSLDPPLVLWCLRRHAPSLAQFHAAGRFAVNVLSADQDAVARRFATRGDDKFAGVPHAPGLGDCPLIAGCLATFECEVDATPEGGDHVIFIGRVMRAAYRDGEPLVFSAGRYRRLADDAGEPD